MKMARDPLVRCGDCFVPVLVHFDFQCLPAVLAIESSLCRDYFFVLTMYQDVMWCLSHLSCKNRWKSRPSIPWYDCCIIVASIVLRCRDLTV